MTASVEASEDAMDDPPAGRRDALGSVVEVTGRSPSIRARGRTGVPERGCRGAGDPTRGPGGRGAESSDALAEVGGHRAVVAHRLVELSGLGPMMPGGQLHERRTDLRGEPLGLGHQQPADATLAHTRVDDEREDAD